MPQKKDESGKPSQSMKIVKVENPHGYADDYELGVVDGKVVSVRPLLK